MSLAHLPLSDLLSAFASPDPTPGGGSAAALAGAVGASLVAMVAGLPKTKTNTPEERASLDAARATLDGLGATLVSLVDRDAAAYDLVVAAFRRPKATGEEKAARAAAIQDAMKVATEAPLDTLRAAAQAMTAARAVADAGNPSAKSDLAVGVQLLTTAMQGAALNIEINIGSVKDQAFVDQVGTAMRALRTEAGDALRHVYEAAGILDLLMQSAKRSGFMPAHVATESVPPARLLHSATALLQRAGGADARRALEALAASDDAEVAAAARKALDSAGQPQAASFE